MTKISWDSASKRYNYGVDRGVLYVPGKNGVPWNGLISVEDKSKVDVNADYYLDGVRYNIDANNEEFEFEITAFTYPDEFDDCIGYSTSFDLQPKKTFGLAYRTSDGASGQIHLIYNATVTSDDISRKTLSRNNDALDFSWSASTKNVAVNTLAPTAHIIIDLASLYSGVQTVLFNQLYGTTSTNPTLPSISTLISLFAGYATLTVVDNGDGTWTATGPATNIVMVDATTFEIDSGALSWNDKTSYRLSDF